MRPTRVNKRYIEQPTEVMMLDEVEMAMTLADLAETTTYSDRRRKPVAPIRSADLQTELLSAACLVLDPEEAEMLQKELDEALRQYQPKAA